MGVWGTFTGIVLGQVVNKPDHGSLDWVKICEKSSKVITFIDLAGHEKYLKTTVFGMTGHPPDFSMLLVSGCTIVNFQLQKSRKIYLIRCKILNIQLFIHYG